MIEILMPRKTLALIAGLVVVTIVLFIIALRTGQQQEAPSVPQNATIVHQQTTSMIPAHTALSLGPNPLFVAPGQMGSVTVTMNTSDNNVTGVQLELGYDPNVISIVKIMPGPLFTAPSVLIDKNNPITGRYTYAMGITPSGQGIKGTGVIATITFTTKATALGKNTQIGLLPTTLVTARGVAESVLKSVNGTVVSVQSGTPVKITTGVTTGVKTSVTSAAAPTRAVGY